MQLVLELIGQDWEQDLDIQTQLYATFEQIERACDTVIDTLDEMVDAKHRRYNADTFAGIKPYEAPPERYSAA